MESLGNALKPILERLSDNKSDAAARGDSVLEERFWSLVRQSRDGDYYGLDQFEIGQYRVDSIFLIDANNAVIIELDGQAYHQDKQADAERDDVLLQSVSAIIHLPYRAVMQFPMATFHVLAAWYGRFTLSRDSHRVVTWAELQKIKDGEADTEEWAESVGPYYEVYAIGTHGASVYDAKFACGIGLNTHAITYKTANKTLPEICDRIRAGQRTHA